MDKPRSPLPGEVHVYGVQVKWSQSIYDIYKAIKDAKCEWTKLESQGNHMDARQLWPGLHTAKDYKVKLFSITGNMFPSDELYTFQHRFEQ